MGTELILSPAGVTFCRGVQRPDHESSVELTVIARIRITLVK